MSARSLLLVVVLVAPVAALAGSLFEARPAAQSQDTLEALLVEVRGLRAAMEQLASAGPRMQLLFGRLQIQEQRVNSLGRRLEAVRERISSSKREQESRLTFSGQIEQTLSRLPSAPGRVEMETALARMKGEMARHAEEVQSLEAEEALIASEIANEQARWSEINRALDELDRALIRR